MALHNVDRNSMDRSNPNPNTHDVNYITNAPIVNIPRPAHNTLSVNYLANQTPSTLTPLKNGQFRIVAVVTGTYTINATDASNGYANLSLAHNLGYKPSVEGSFILTSDNTSRQMPYDYRSPAQTYFQTATTSSAAVYVYSVDSTNINVGIKIFDILGFSWLLASTTLNFTFYCLQQVIAG